MPGRFRSNRLVKYPLMEPLGPYSGQEGIGVGRVVELDYEWWFRAPEWLCVAGAGRQLLESGVQTRKSGGGKMDLQAILVVHLAPSVHVWLTLFGYSGRMRTAVPVYPQTRCEVKPVFVDNVSIAGSTC